MSERQGYRPDEKGRPANNSVDNFSPIPPEYTPYYIEGLNAGGEEVDNGAVVQSQGGADISVPKNEVVKSGTIFHHLANSQNDPWSRPRPQSGLPRGPGSIKARENMRRVKKQENIIGRLNRINI